MDSSTWAGTLTRLTPAERRVLQRLAQGLSNKEIAASLDCSHKTVENHLVAMTKKFEPRARREELIRWAWEYRHV